MLDLTRGRKLARSAGRSEVEVKRELCERREAIAAGHVDPVISAACAYSCDPARASGEALRNEFRRQRPHGRTGFLRAQPPHSACTAGLRALAPGRNACKTYRTCKKYAGRTLGEGAAFLFYARPRGLSATGATGWRERVLRWVHDRRLLRLGLRRRASATHGNGTAFLFPPVDFRPW
jgi:hypothetical protein